MTELAAIREDFKDLKVTLNTLIDTTNTLVSTVERMDERDKLYTHQFKHLEKEIEEVKNKVNKMAETVTKNDQVSSTIKIIAVVAVTAFISGGVGVLWK